MNKHPLVLALLGAGTALAATLLAEAQPAPGQPGWTGLTHPEEVIAARQALMFEIERLMKPLDSFTVGEPVPAEEIESRAITIGEILHAVPHLFPPTTNLYDPSAETPPTIALPAIWQSFDTFYALAGNAINGAHALAEAKGADAQRTAIMQLRGTCDACHALYLREYVPAQVTEEDLEFDFDSVLPK